MRRPESLSGVAAATTIQVGGATGKHVVARDAAQKEFA